MQANPHLIRKCCANAWWKGSVGLLFPSVLRISLVCFSPVTRTRAREAPRETMFCEVSPWGSWVHEAPLCLWSFAVMCLPWRFWAFSLWLKSHSLEKSQGKKKEIPPLCIRQWFWGVGSDGRKKEAIPFLSLSHTQREPLTLLLSVVFLSVFGQRLKVLLEIPLLHF